MSRSDTEAGKAALRALLSKGPENQRMAVLEALDGAPDAIDSRFVADLTELRGLLDNDDKKFTKIMCSGVAARIGKEGFSKISRKRIMGHYKAVGRKA